MRVSRPVTSCQEDPTLSRRPEPNPQQTRRDRRRVERETRRQREVKAAGRPAWQSPTVLTTIAALVVGLGIIGAIVLTQTSASPGAKLAPPVEAVPAGVPVDGQTLGKADAKVTLKIYSDFQCPACDDFATNVEPRIRNDFVVPGTLRIVYLDAAFQGAKAVDKSYDESVEPAAAARCAGQQGKFWQYHDWLFANQHGENEGAFKRDRLTTIAQSVGLDMTAWTSCVDSGTEQAAVKTATQQAVAAKVDSTPTLELNGTRYVGALPYDQLASAIRAIVGGSPAPSSASPSATGASPSP